MKRIYLFGLALVAYTGATGQTLSENFDSYSVGDYIGVVSPDFTTWSGAEGGAEDTQITDSEAASGTNSVYLSTTVTGGGPQDMIIPFGDMFTIGQLTFESKFYVEENKGAYFNFQGTETPGGVWVMNCQMVDDGRLLMDAGGAPLIETTYPSETWFTITVNVDFNTNTWELLIDGASKGTFATDVNTAGAVNIYPVNSASGGNGQAGFYLDDVSFDYTPYTLPTLNAAPILIENISGLATTEITPSVQIRNLGTNDITSFDVEVTYNGTTINESVTGISLSSLDVYTVNFSDELTLIAGDNPIVAIVSNVNGGTDDDAGDDEKIQTINPVVPATGKVVIGEEATGTWCGWCPRGAVYLEYMADNYPDHFVGIAVHNGDPMVVDTYDSGMGTLISGYPSLVVDRGADIDPSAVEGDFLDRVVIAPKAVLTIGSDYTEGASSMNVSVTADFNEAVSGNYRLACVIIEDGVTGTGSGYNQSNYYAGGGSGEMGGYESLPNPVPAADMVYDHVARAILPGFTGMAGSFPATVEAGEEHTVGFLVEIDPEWDLDKVHIVGMLIDPAGDIDNGGYASMDEAVENGYLGLFETPVVTSAVDLYPNPAVNQTNIDLGTVDNENVIVRVYSINGELVAERNYGSLNGAYILPLGTDLFESGVYTVHVFKGNELSVKKLIIE